MTTLEDAEEVFQRLNISEYDLRILDPSLPPASSSMLSPKGQCTMLSLKSLSIIIAEEYSLYIESSQSASVIIDETARRLRERVTYGSHNAMSAEIFVLDTILDIFLTTQITNASYWEKEATPTIEKIERGISVDSLQKLKLMKSRLNRMILDTETVKETLGRALTDECADRVRVTLEIYYMSFNVQTLKIKEYVEDISSAENSNSIRVDAQRNQILKFELVTLVFTLGLTVVSAISGIFGEGVALEVFPNLLMIVKSSTNKLALFAGQNLSNASLTTVHYSFGVATSIYSLSALLIVVLCLWYFKRLEIL